MPEQVIDRRLVQFSTTGVEREALLRACAGDVEEFARPCGDRIIGGTFRWRNEPPVEVVFAPAPVVQRDDDIVVLEAFDLMLRD